MSDYHYELCRQAVVAYACALFNNVKPARPNTELQSLRNFVQYISKSWGLPTDVRSLMNYGQEGDVQY